jgi:hypothetical protein
VENPLSKLKIDYWYKAMLVISTCVLIVSLTVELKGVENSVVQLISLGCAFWGLGEWINHPYQEKIGIGFKISGHPRNGSVAGYAFDLVGWILILIGIFKVFR